MGGDRVFVCLRVVVCALFFSGSTLGRRSGTPQMDGKGNMEKEIQL